MMKLAHVLVFAFLWGVFHLGNSHENLVAGVRATQSTTGRHFANANNAIDGNHDSLFHHSSCSLTFRQCNPWWRVDLERHFRIFVVRITNVRSQRNFLNGAEIRIGDSLENNGNNNTLCAKIVNIPSGATRDFFCANPRGVHGRFLNIILPICRNRLIICEVEAYGFHDPH
ncbi:fucolectin-like [Scyliorhinus torazame]|uniref:fucolectin-like n=1 Tax=Scyliorhinus torazame TaxID=75743 RepID=UPI003B590FC6